MRATLAALLLIVCVDLSAFASGDSARVVINHFAFSYGIGIPTGDFASTATGTDESGYALNSTNLDLTYTVRNEARPYGFLATFRRSSFDYNMAGALNNFTDGANWTGQGENWETTLVHIGFFRHVPLGKTFSLEPKAGLGMLFLGSKARTFKGTGGPYTGTRKLEFMNESSSSYAFLFGLNLRWQVAGAVAIFAAFDFFTSTPTVLYTAKLTYNGSVQTYSSAFSQPVSAWTALGGISIGL